MCAYYSFHQCTHFIYCHYGQYTYMHAWMSERACVVSGNANANANWHVIERIAVSNILHCNLLLCIWTNSAAACGYFHAIRIIYTINKQVFLFGYQPTRHNCTANNAKWWKICASNTNLIIRWLDMVSPQLMAVQSCWICTVNASWLNGKKPYQHVFSSYKWNVLLRNCCAWCVQMLLNNINFTTYLLPCCGQPRIKLTSNHMRYFIR